MRVKIHRFMNWPTAILVLVVGFLALVAPLWSDRLSPPPTSPLSYTELPFAVDSPVKAGETMRVHVGRCNSADDQITYGATRVLRRIDVQPNTVRALEFTGSTITPGCEQIVSDLTRIPVEMKTGRYVLEAVSIVPYRERTYQVPWTTQPFDVVGV